MAGVDGNWQCSLCGNVNFSHRDACNKCGLPREHSDPTDPLGHETRGTKRAREAPVAGVDGNWRCSQCANINFGARDFCNMCGAPKNTPRFVAPPPGGARATPIGAWIAADALGQYTPGDGGKGRSDRTPSGAPIAGVGGNWSCAECGNVNFSARTSCNRCGAPRPPERPAAAARGAAPVAGVDGNWECAHCGNVNYAARMECNRCKAPREDVFDHAPVDLQPRGGCGAVPSAASRGPPVAGVDGNWRCPACGNVNFAARQSCNRCQAPRPPPPRPEFAPAAGKGCGKGPPAIGVDGNWKCLECGNVNFGHRNECNRCHAPRPAPAPTRAKGPPVEGVDGNWKCVHCNNVNYGHREECNRCHAPRSESVDEALLQVDEALLHEQAADSTPAKRARTGP